MPSSRASAARRVTQGPSIDCAAGTGSPSQRRCGALQRVRVHVPDRPGVLSGITQALGAEQINIEDFELQHMSPERGGTLSVLVSGEDEARRAAALLEAQGYSVIVSPAFEDE